MLIGTKGRKRNRKILQMQNDDDDLKKQQNIEKRQIDITTHINISDKHFEYGNCMK